MANGSGDRRITSWTENLVARAATGRFLDFIAADCGAAPWPISCEEWAPQCDANRRASMTIQSPCNGSPAKVILIQEIFATKRGTNEFSNWTRSRRNATESLSRRKLL